MHPLDVLEIVGAVTILIAFAAAQAGRLQQRTVAYQLLNLLGSGVLATIAAVQLSWGFLLLEGSWAVISLLGLLNLARTRQPDRTPVATSHDNAQNASRDNA